MLDPDVRRQLREHLEELAERGSPEDDADDVSIAEVRSLLDALDEADLLRRNFNTLGDVNRELAAERDALAEALAVAREHIDWCREEHDGREGRRALARIDTIAPQGEPT